MIRFLDVSGYVSNVSGLMFFWMVWDGLQWFGMLGASSCTKMERDGCEKL